MRTTKHSWVEEYNDYQLGSTDSGTRGPATAYYRKEDVCTALIHLGATPEQARAAKPGDAWNDYSDVDYVVANQVRPYRIVR